MLYSFRGKITDREAALFSVPEGKKYLVKSLVILNNCGTDGVMFNLIVKYGVKLTQYIIPKNLVLDDKETFIMDYDLVLDSGDSLRSVIIPPQTFFATDCFLDFNATVEEI